MFKLSGSKANFIVSCIASYGGLLENILVIIFMIFKCKWLLGFIGGLAVLYIACIAALFYEGAANRGVNMEFISEDEEEF